jgi:hypothetical protein
MSHQKFPRPSYLDLDDHLDQILMTIIAVIYHMELMCNLSYYGDIFNRCGW